MKFPVNALALLALGIAHSSFADVTLPFFERGHLKGQRLTSTYPDDSALRDFVDAVAHDQGGELRLNFRTGADRFSIAADYQFLIRTGDSLELAGVLPDFFQAGRGLPTDDRRWWDLTHEISESDDSLVSQRLDRLHLDYSGDKAVVRFGRQAVSWGNGLIYNPMDFFNPFDPAAVDTEYKLGDDMLYGQYLLDNGSDWQAVSVQRRDADGDHTSDVSSTALKFHGFALEREYDVLVADHYQQTILAAGGTLNIGEAVVRGDLVFTEGEQEWVSSMVLNWSYSWVWGGYNVSAVTEYFFNGFGLREDDYTAQDLAGADDLTQRLARGELFTLGRHYLAGSLMVEVTPLLNITPNLFLNLGDQSALAQVVAQWDLAQNWQVLGSLNLPLGPAGTEFGGLELEQGELTLSAGPSFFLQFGFYF